MSNSAMVDHRQVPPPPDTDEPVDVSLNKALNDLEQILENSETEPKPRPAEPDLLGDQYTIPLLDDVVAPGTELGEDLDDIPVVTSARRLLSLEDDVDCQNVINRLNSEIEVIVQAGLEKALDKAKKDITDQVKKHVSIILPEILDEIAAIKARKGL